MFALVDMNSFHVSCETAFRPDLVGRPIVVLSNNDGCVIARSAEAKRLGIKMGVPWFQLKVARFPEPVIGFSSNYELYGDMSHRVMTTLEGMCPRVEVYSIDEAFWISPAYVTAGTWPILGVAQRNLFDDNAPRADSDALMALMDRLNQQGRGTLYFAGQGVQQAWQMKREMLSPCYTTRLSDIPIARAN